MQTNEYIQHGVTVREHRINVPLDHFAPADAPHSGQEIELFAREVIGATGTDVADCQLPYLVFLQGGPGGAGPRAADFNSLWSTKLLGKYRVVLMDQRGTGQSSVIDAVTLTDPRLRAPQAMADYLSLFLQDQIIADAEALRRYFGVEKWSTLGQSYGGFLTLTYLSFYPESVTESFVTGGLAGLTTIDDIYRQTYALTAKRNQTYFARYAQDEKTVREVAAHVLGTEELLPNGERLSPTRLRTLGMNLGMQGRFDMLHYLFEGPFVHVGGQKRLSQEFLSTVGADVSMADRPLYGLLHEAIYAQLNAQLTGQGTNWSAQRLAAQTPGFNLDANPLDFSEPWYLSGEHMYRQAFLEDKALAPAVPAVDILAARTDWRPAYDLDALAANQVPVSAAVYYDDMFVPRQLSMDTASRVGCVRTWVTSEYQHDGLRAGGSHVFDHLSEMIKD